MSRTAHKLVASSGSKDAYEIDQSLMFDDGDTSYLTRSPGSAGNLKTWTLSFWIKRANLGALQILYSASNSGSGATDYGIIYFDSSDRLGFYYANITIALTNRVFRDVSSWYHIYIKLDTTQGTASDRWDIKINGVSETSFSESNTPAQNTDIAWNNNIAHYIGRTHGGYYYPGYIAEFHNIDGTAKAVTEFAETDSETGQWIPKKYGGGSYGTTGFYLPFAKNARYCVYFDGSTSTGIEIADNADFDVGSGNFTIEAWVYVNEDAGNTRYISGQSSSSGANSSGAVQFQIGSNNKLTSYIFDASDTDNYLTLEPSSATISDNKWHHVAIVRNGTAFNLYQDGTSIANVTSSITVNNSTAKFAVGCLGEYTAGHFKGWISNYRFVKGTAVYTSNFTPATSPLTAITNTKLLCCQDSTVTTDNSGTSKTLTVTAANTYSQQMSPFTYDWYQDQSGQDNHWQADNLTINDVMQDSPTNNFAIMNPLVVTGADGITFKQGALQPVSGGAFAKSISSFAPSSGKWYCEYHVDATTSNFGGVGATTLNDMSTSHIGYSTGETHWIINHSTATSQTVKVDNVSTGASSLGSVSVGDIIGLSLDADNGKIYFRKNNSVIGTSTGYAITDVGTGNYWFVAYLRSQGAYGYGTFNFGQNGTFCGSVNAQGNTDGNGIGDFYYSPPSGYIALCSQNLPTSAIKDSSAHFQTTLYAGDSNNSTVITNSGNSDLQPDLIWIKNRTHGSAGTGSHMLFDAVRGFKSTTGSDSPYLSTNASDAEVTNSNGLQAVSSDGFTPGSMTRTNETGDNLVAWQWKAGGGAGSSNTDGTINTISTSVNTTAGFSISTYTGTGSNATVGHGLGAVPATMWIKNRDTNDNWRIYSNEDPTDYMAFNWTGASTDDNTSWNDTAPTSSVFSIGTDTNTNRSGDKFIAYCFAEVEGFSSFGTYTGNGASEDGPFIHTGFKPRLVIAKKSSAAGSSWFMWDSLRHPENVIDLAMWVGDINGDTSHAEYEIDFLSNGFKIRGQNAGSNASGETHIYMAWAESPFKYANAR
jgi:hypothetical protein